MAYALGVAPADHEAEGFRGFRAPASEHRRGMVT
jgi:hypothetical protein